MDAFDVVVLGDANPDLVLRGEGLAPLGGQRERLVEQASFTVGGSGAIFACAAARLGLRVAFVGVVGEDRFGSYLREELDARGVDTRGLVVSRTRPTGVSVVLSSPGDRGIVTAAGTTAELRAADVDRTLLSAGRHVHVSSFFLQDALRPDLPALLDDAHAAGARTSLDPNWDPTEGWDGGLDGALGRIDLFLPNAAEACRIAGAEDLGKAVAELGRRAGTVAVKLGGGGGLVHVAGRTTRLPGIEVEVVDTTGAGDAFDAGFVYGALQGWPPERALALANVCGGLSCRALGGVDAQPTLEEALARLPAVAG